MAIDFNPRSPHGERRSIEADGKREEWISIHAPRTGSDACGCDEVHRVHHFNPRSPHGERHCKRTVPCQHGSISIHAPRTGSDQNLTLSASVRRKFQSTLPARGATIYPSIFTDLLNDFNPRSPHGERRFVVIHAVETVSFQSTLPARGATRNPSGLPYCASGILIHAPRTGSDYLGSNL